ncbi:VOC family protein [Desulfosporosinus nitroreducens]|uniref:VOC family protein n=1 Tax=Desulfosporosinus nitroreducens TaxID=2018668 RepID=UPI00207D01CE|nr:VOC family protein [Desulfosporosinus nitroreducens]MCO1603649.1 VOC family protein [Desulfosporosinus nitroreducens]
MKFGGPLLAVNDIKESKKFYEDVLGQKAELDLGTHVSFGAGFSIQEKYAELIGINPNSVLRQSNNFQLYFEVEDLDSWNTRIKNINSLEYIHDIKEYEWGQRVFRFYDPDRHIIEIAESMESVVKRFLSQGMSVEETAKRSMFPIEFVKQCL